MKLIPDKIEKFCRVFCFWKVSIVAGEKYEITFGELPLVGSSLTLRMTVIYVGL
jgi:hypothetical protein